MSDPMTNNDIEDVLSSIRRLVSQDHSDVASDVARDSDDAGRGRLLLTPAQRVAEARDAGESAPSGANSQTAPESAGEAATEPAPPEAGMHAEAGATRDSLEKTIAELEAAVSVYEEEWEPDGSEAAAVPSEGTEHPPAVRLPGPVPQSERSLPSEAQAPDAAEHDENASPARWEQPDNVWPFTVEKTVQGGIATDEVPARDPAGAGNFTSTQATGQFSEPGEEDDLEAVLDEETLRDLVAEIVREELQGELGERITRNVRKLVRSEIARALASRTLEQ